VLGAQVQRKFNEAYRPDAMTPLATMMLTAGVWVSDGQLFDITAIEMDSENSD